VEITRLPAPGKLNLFLHVLGRRADGYHELQTVFRLIDRADSLRIEARDDGEIRFVGPYGDDNLCVRAARLLKTHTSTRLGADLELDKRLPVGGGLGGGSSDAATVLIALNRLWDLRLSRAELLELAPKLGADVAFFLCGTNAVGEGIGDQLSPIELPSAWYLVLTPQVTVSTKEIFASALTGKSKRIKIPPFFAGQGVNDLEAVVTARYPEVAASLSWLHQHTSKARMTGSGACLFAEFATQAEALALHARLPVGMSGFVAQGLDRHPLHDWIA
jgi:4-diphosphocytidyl-2-C-methyl-D-erythritol kinase